MNTGPSARALLQAGWWVRLMCLRSRSSRKRPWQAQARAPEKRQAWDLGSRPKLLHYCPTGRRLYSGGGGNELGIINLDGNNLKKKVGWHVHRLTPSAFFVVVFFFVAPMVPVVGTSTREGSCGETFGKEKEKLRATLHVFTS